MQIKDRIFIISGGAGGLGEQVVRSIVAEEGIAIIIDLDKDRSNQLVEELGSRVYFPGPIDATSETGIEEALTNSAAHFPEKSFGGAVLCSGVVLPPKEIHGYGPNKALTSYRQFQHLISVNLLGTYNVAQQVAQYLIAQPPANDDQERGVIITVSSMLGLDGTLVGYATSKAGVAGLTLPLARELAEFGIRVMSISPGPFDTPLLSKTAEFEAPPCLFPHRLGQATEFSELVLHILSNRMLNGSVIRLDGALRG
ncbi:Short-chain dehydrogenase reductase SDR [Apophysomyces ossiformis]|uniref:Short-chain dehydrogenase reductase SDR n=1 Tax=Apophysomyces ossiformis TaxID=679940 RepID=A0A8H7BSR0_9FUNG|nr:Short-chain dehydrogenase reductase SDR [Apophysomyces ossiformis]